MPPKATKCARDDGFIVFGGIIALMAQYRVAIIIPNPEEIRRFLVAAFPVYA